MKKRLGLIALLLAVALLFAACSGDREMKKAVGTCGEREILYEELRYVVMTYREAFESTYGEGIWEDPEASARYLPELRETVLRVLRNNYAVLALCDEYMPGITVETKAIKASVDQQIDELREIYGSRAALEEELENLHMTEHFLRFTLGVAALENELLYVMGQDLGMFIFDEAEFLPWLKDGNCVYVQHIFIRNDEGDDPSANRAAAESVREQLLSGTDIGRLVGSAVNEDLSNTAPYYVVKGVYAEPIEEAVFALSSVGSVSPVVSTDDGFYVFQRIEASDATLSGKITALLDSYRWAMLEGYVEQAKEGLSVELNEFGEGLDFLTLS